MMYQLVKNGGKLVGKFVFGLVVGVLAAKGKAILVQKAKQILNNKRVPRK